MLKANIRTNSKKVLFTISLFLFAVLSISLTQSIAAHAAPQASWISTNPTTNDPVKETEAWLYYKLFRVCFAESGFDPKSSTGGGTSIAQAQAESLEWFSPGIKGALVTAKKPGVILDNALNDSDDVTACGGDDAKIWIPKFLSAFNYSSGPQFLCDIGLYRETDKQNNKMFNNDTYDTNQTSCPLISSTGTNDFYVYDKEIRLRLLDTQFAKIFNTNGSSPATLDSLSPAAKYIFYKNSFLAGDCAVPTGKITTAGNSTLNGADYGIDDMEDGKPIRVLYSRNNADILSTTPITVYENVDKGLREISCKDLAKEANAAFSGYMKLVESGAHQGDSGGLTSGPTQAVDGVSTCAIEGIGWLLCPLLTAGAGLADGAYDFLKENFLETDTNLLNTDPDKTQVGQPVGTGAYSAWKIMQSIGNVAFIIAVLIIIFSQLTSVGVSNYGVKKLLPRIVVAAILVNLSFILCQLAVDVSNILGYSVKDLFTGVADQVKEASGGAAITAGDQSGNLIGITATVLVIGSLAWVNIGALMVAIVGALIALLTIFVLLIVRKVLIVLLVVIAPLAFVAYLLPNTESLFKKWWKMLSALLLLFPIIGLVYGVSILASTILLQAAGSDTVLQIAAYMALVVPLIVVIPLLKGSLDGVGKLGGAIQKFGSSQGGKLGKATGAGFESSRLGQFKKYRQNERNLRRAQTQSGTYSGKNPLRAGLSQINRGINESKLSGKFGDRALATGSALADKEHDELVKNASTRLESTTFTDASGVSKPLSQAQMMQIATGKDVTDSTGAVVASRTKFDESTRLAAIQKAAKIATVGDAHELINASGAMDTIARKTLSASIAASSVLAKAPYLGGKTLGDIEQGTATTRSASLGALKNGKITAEALAGTDKDSANELLAAAMSTAENSPERLALKAAYAKLNDPASRLGEKVVSGGDHDRALSGIRSL